MTDFPPEIQRTARPVFGVTKPGHPVYLAWVFDPVQGVAHVSNDHKRPRRHKKHHEELAEKVNHHPDREHGYAYRLRVGWRITDANHNAVDRHIMKSVHKAIKEHESE